MVCFSQLGFPNSFFSQNLARSHDKELKVEGPPKAFQSFPPKYFKSGQDQRIFKGTGEDKEAGAGMREPKSPEAEKGRLSGQDHCNEVFTVVSGVPPPMVWNLLLRPGLASNTLLEDWNEVLSSPHSVLNNICIQPCNSPHVQLPSHHPSPPTHFPCMCTIHTNFREHYLRSHSQLLQLAALVM